MSSPAPREDPVPATLDALREHIDQRLDDLRDAVLCLVRPAPAAPSWPPPGYPPSRRHGLRAVKS